MKVQITEEMEAKCHVVIKTHNLGVEELKDPDGEPFYVVRVGDGYLKWIESGDHRICRINPREFGLPIGRKKDAEDVVKYIAYLIVTQKEQRSGRLE